MKIARPASVASLCAAVALVALAGCAGYQAQTKNTVGAMQHNSIDVAIADLDRNNPSADKDLLYFLERGELLRMKGVYVESRDQWLVADGRVRAWEDQAKKDSSKLLGEIGSYVLNDTTRVYDGKDYEKVFLNVRLALDHLALGSWDNARTEIKKMHEREAIIADFHAKQIEAAKKAAKDNGLTTTSFKELDGYPVETLNDPQVQALKNGYESAFANYLAGFVYEALGEPSLAAPGYRKAAEMQPNIPAIDEGLRGLDARSRSRQSKTVDTLIVVESGTAPAILSRTLPIVLPVKGKRGTTFKTSVSWPVILPSDRTGIPTSVVVDKATVPVVLLTNVDVMARRSLSDEMRSIIARTSIRAIAKGAAQKSVDDAVNKKPSAAGSLLKGVLDVATIATEVADERSWRTLPGAFSVARVPLTEGPHQLAVMTGGGLQTVDVNVAGRYAVVTMRTSGAALYMAQTPVPVAQSVAANPR